MLTLIPIGIDLSPYVDGVALAERELSAKKLQFNMIELPLLIAQALTWSSVPGN